jgi:hypothetical protein
VPLRLPSRRPAVRRTALLVGLALAVVLPAAPALAAPESRSPVPQLEAFSPYQGQTVCEPVLRDGVVRFRDLVLAAYPATGDSGILRACDVGGTSEHKEGRAWDWRVNTKNPADVLAVQDLMAWLLAADELGNPAAMARRLGVMYVIWDSKVWKSYQAAKGWQPYSGASPHTDHVHFSFGWAGALGATSYWSGQVAPVMTRPEPVVVSRSLIDLRRLGKSSLPGPWRRH